MPDGADKDRNPSSRASSAGLPAVLSAVSRPPLVQPVLAGAAFLSQLIAERQHLPIQRERRRAPLEAALGSYKTTEIQAIRRVPPGYRRTLVV